MAGKQQGFFLLAAFLLTAAALTSALEDVGQPKQSADMLPPAPLPQDITTPKPPTTTHTTTTQKPTTTTHTTTTPKPTTTTHTTTTPKPTTTTHTTTTPKPTTTTHTTTTPKPTTTTHTTTTPKPTTTTHTTHTTTTPKPTTTTHTTTTSKTTSVPPTPTPSTNATVGNYTVKDGNNLCVMVQAVIEIHVNNSKAAGNYIVQPGTTKFTGTCEKTSATLKLLLTEGSISMTFTKNDTVKKVYVSSVAVNLTYAFKAGASYTLTPKNDSLQLFSMATSHSYSCKSESVFMGDGIFLKFSQNRMQAFNFTNNQFGQFDLCKADEPDYRVAIGVGIVLLILIIIVVLAYIISRRKRTDGYQSL